MGWHPVGCIWNYCVNPLQVGCWYVGSNYQPICWFALLDPNSVKHNRRLPLLRPEQRWWEAASALRNESKWQTFVTSPVNVLVYDCWLNWYIFKDNFVKQEDAFSLALLLMPSYFRSVSDITPVFCTMSIPASHLLSDILLERNLLL